MDDVFAEGTDGLEPSADFGFDRWVGTEDLRAGYAASLARVEAAIHATSNLLLTADDDGMGITARYYVQGWHWLLAANGTTGAARPADFLVLGRMTDRCSAPRPGAGAWSSGASNASAPTSPWAPCPTGCRGWVPPTAPPRPQGRPDGRR